MSLITDLDAWTTALGTAVGITATREPAAVNPPCLFVGLPATAALSLSAFVLELPVWLVAAGAGKQAGDQLLTYLEDTITALEVKTADADSLILDGVEFHAYRLTARINVTP
jgi:hypothetical protein